METLVRITFPAHFIFFLLMTTILTLFNSQLCWADMTENRAQLEKIQSRIERAEKNLKQKKKSELNISRELTLVRRTLKAVDKRIGELKKEVVRLNEETLQQQTRIAHSHKKANQIAKQLRKRFVALYKEGDVGPLKILFSADSVTAMVQQYHYLSRVLKHDKELLADYRQAIEDQQQQLDRLTAIKQKKTALLDREKQQRTIAAQGRLLQARLLKTARVEKKKLAKELAQLKANEAQLKKLILRLEKTTESVSGSGTGNFAVGRGKLAWPVRGRVVIGFGQQKDSKLGTYYESNGIEIATPPGSPVRAVAAGKVVFADYFKGYGNLFILSHPGGYHTLYAQIDQMAKKLGDKISAGDLLGKSGLDGRDSIYFEIRSKGSPINPLAWLKRR